MMHGVDWLPTLVEAVSAPLLPSWERLDGISQWLAISRVIAANYGVRIAFTNRWQGKPTKERTSFLYGKHDHGDQRWWIKRMWPHLTGTKGGNPTMMLFGMAIGSWSKAGVDLLIRTPAMERANASIWRPTLPGVARVFTNLGTSSLTPSLGKPFRSLCCSTSTRTHWSNMNAHFSIKIWLNIWARRWIT